MPSPAQEQEQVLLTQDRRDRLDEAIAHAATEGDWAPVMDRLRCLRGISTVTAFGLATEIGDWHRFTGSSIGAYVVGASHHRCRGLLSSCHPCVGVNNLPEQNKACRLTTSTVARVCTSSRRPPSLGRTLPRRP
ncbi:hypothetical protein F4561_003580 [Lipingzhangella halophila]|uniref:Transposase IS116/IS110/IS902 family protein n=1 Tax=Lipingzhangella halophila TaxID=1783352 RepID=A0A7W7W4I1_9ACTN|nr:hypothetical protein [Lipingzhangella halophila]MBB4932760.1 hypothetical protein [Lipingzhangella halophila]